MGERARRGVAAVAAAALVALLAFAVFSGAVFTHGAAAILEYTPPPVNDVPPSISGNAVVGATLTGDPGVWDGATKFAYEWRRCTSGCPVIKGATKTAYKVQQADLGARLLFVVTASNKSASASAAAITPGVVVEAPLVKTLPKVTGQLAVGQQLTASDGTWLGTQPIAFTYAWDRCDAKGKSCATIAGANASAYTLVGDDGGHRLRAEVTATNSVGNHTAVSATTATVLAAPANTSLPTIAGTPKKGKVLKASAGSWTGSMPIAYSYRWQRCDAAGNGCTPLTAGPSYAVKAADVGSTLRVAVTAKNSAGSATATSAATAAVSALQHR